MLDHLSFSKEALHNAHHISPSTLNRLKFVNSKLPKKNQVKENRLLK
ncbi:15141_t:CDS:2 [Dentiscutata heterogama]|uniref:15141_t:CDS:1 n=1 Tax=Dentiscutata heterogama TaxID=1316150 RepID=A0ACA9JXA7_9GLOM|nr:15141_t:CDS:2 [Dentiscutata heterogama]